MGVYYEVKVEGVDTESTPALSVLKGTEGVVVIIADIAFESIFLTFEQVDNLILDLMNIKEDNA